MAETFNLHEDQCLQFQNQEQFDLRQDLIARLEIILEKAQLKGMR